jgi:hypothetical protein
VSIHPSLTFGRLKMRPRHFTESSVAQCPVSQPRRMKTAEKKQHVLSTIVQMLDVITSFNFFFAVLFEVNVDGVSIF